MRTDKFVVRCVVVALVVVAVGSLVFNGALVLTHRHAEAFLTHAFDISFGALAALLAKTSTFDDDLNELAGSSNQGPPGPPGPPGPAGLMAPGPAAVRPKR